MNFKRALAAGTVATAILTGGTMSATAASAQVATPSTPAGMEIGQQGIINLILNVNKTLDKVSVLRDVGQVKIVSIEHSLNKLINQSDVLSHKVVVLHHFLRNCNVLSCFVIDNFLNKLHVKIGDIVAIELLNGNDIKLFRRPLV